MRKYTIKINPRWQNARYEQKFICHPIDIKINFLRDGFCKQEIPTRYESIEDFKLLRNSIPPYIKVYEDGTTEEIQPAQAKRSAAMQ